MSEALDSPQSAAYDEDLRLLERLKGGDDEAFQSLYSRYFDKIYAIARGILLNDEEAADATQEIFTLVYRKARKFDGKAKFSTWLYRVAVNRSIQEARKLKGRRRESPLTQEVEDVPVEPEAPVGPLPAVQAAMQQLAPDDRAILTLFYWDELTLNEIGDSMGCSPNAAKTRLFRARERFRKHFEEASA